MATVSVGLSLTLHGVVVWRIAMHAPLTARDAEQVPIEIETYAAEPKTRAAAPPITRLASLSRRSSSRGSSHAALRAPATPATEARGAATTTAPTAPEAPRVGPVDLFAPAAIAKIVGPPAPRSQEQETVAGRVRAMVDESVARERAQSGNVAPHWRDIERKLVQQFHPPVGVVKQENVALALGHQILRAWLDGPPKTGTAPPPPALGGIDPSVETLPGTPPGLNLKSLPEAQALAVQGRWGEPATWLRVEVEVTIDDEGRIVAARVVKPSGRRLFDRTALGAVEDAIRAGGAPDEHRAVTTRWLVEAAMAVAPPTSIGLRFDETTGKVTPTYPLQQSVVSHVSLVGIEAQR